MLIFLVHSLAECIITPPQKKIKKIRVSSHCKVFILNQVQTDDTLTTNNSSNALLLQIYIMYMVVYT